MTTNLLQSGVAPVVISPAEAGHDDRGTIGIRNRPGHQPGDAGLQSARVAAARGIPVEQVRAIVAAHTHGRYLGVLGEPDVNVLMLNLDLDRQVAKK